jgi:3-deoxy-D-manno-octulosonic-acid transferase
MILLYNIFWILISPFVVVLMIFRIVTGKEDILRIRERFGLPVMARSLKHDIIWIHAASVGESKIALTLAKYLHKTSANYKILITTGTLTSAQIVRKSISSNLMHQYIPIDNYISIWLFFKYWKPKIGILIESELWPNLLHIGANNCNLILANARMSDKSFATWTKYKFVARILLNKLKIILCQSEGDYKKYISLGASNTVVGNNLKYAGNKLEVDSHIIKTLTNLLKGREIFLAASTHPGDEEIAINAHIKLRKKYSNLLTIIVPRHIGRMSEIKRLAENNILDVSVRSNKDKISQKTDIYIADTMGELGVFFSVAKATFLAGSFKQGGHNLIEPAYFGTIIIFGPNMSNCQEVAEEFLEKKAAYQINDTEELIDILDKIYSGKIKDDMGKKEMIIQNHNNIINNYLSHINKYLK